jgi:hypothetical protein
MTLQDRELRVQRVEEAAGDFAAELMLHLMSLVSSPGDGMLSLPVEKTLAAKAVRPDDLLVIRTDNEQILEVEVAGTGKRLEPTGPLIKSRA